jgi:hypothetical protein
LDKMHHSVGFALQVLLYSDYRRLQAIFTGRFVDDEEGVLFRNFEDLVVEADHLLALVVFGVEE